MDAKKYLGFLESLNSPETAPLIEAAIQGFQALFEAPHANTVDGRPIDMHVEDVVDQNGYAIALQYVKELIHNILEDRPLDIPNPGNGEVSHLDHPQKDFSSDSVKNLLMRLRILETWLGEKSFKPQSI